MELSTHFAARGALLDLVREIGPAPVPARNGRKRLLPLAWFGVVAAISPLLAQSAGHFPHAIERAVNGGGWRLVALGALLEAASIGGYVVLLHRLVGGAAQGVRAKDSYDIALAGTAATRLLPTAGLGGAAVTVWALRARGMSGREITERLVAFMLLIYGVYMGALLVCGVDVTLGGATARGHALALLGASIAALLTVAILLLLAAPKIVDATLRRVATVSPTLAPRAETAAAHVPALRAALARAGRELRRPRPALLGAVAWWAFDIGVLVAMLHAFAAPLPVPVVVLAYFLGTMFNLLPLPGSLSGGLAGTLVVFGAPAGGALAAVMAYRTIAVWLPAASGLASLHALRRTVLGWRRDGSDAEGAVTRTRAHLLSV